MKTLTKIFKTNKPIIGMIHLPPLIGYKGYPGIDFIKKRISEEINNLDKSGVHGIMIENNYDIPHKEFVNPEITAQMTECVSFTISKTILPVGVCVLWNDYRSGLGICAATGARFMRIPAFVDTVITKYGIMHETAHEAIAYRKRLGLEGKVAFFTDVQVKHSVMMDKKKSLSESVKEAVDKDTDAIIITGKATGDVPKLRDLEIAKKESQGVPILIGSGSRSDNINMLMEMADGIIVGTAIMEKGEINRKKLKKYMESYHVYNSLKRR